MKICVVGAGSIGGYVGVRLALAGEDVKLIARGKNLEAIRAKGMRLTMADGTDHIAPRPASGRPRASPRLEPRTSSSSG